ncbi:DUF805 domain-containing protein [Fructobacillus tropaeoli]|uniref:DUF805 domain-containing protein n=1 Tax=Fructobacillus tropaeoli TaxID=709323 RepID=UPI002D88CC3C|nr:DUF805 family (yhaH) [Fructobacillus tropaeoli]
MTMGASFKSFWKNYFNFTGTATRAEYWWMVLLGGILAILWLIATVIMAVFAGLSPANEKMNIWHWLTTLSGGLILWLVVSSLVFLAILIPSLSLEVRRIRDTGLNAVLVWIVFAIDILSDAFGSTGVLNDIVSLLILLILVFPTDKLANVRMIGKNQR